MKRFEKVLVILIAFFLLLKISTNIAGVDQMLFILLTLLCMFYYVLGFFLMNNVELRNMFKRISYTNISIMRILGSIGASQGLSTLVISVLFILMQYEGDFNLLVIGLVTVLIVVAVSLVRYQARKDRFYLKLISRMCLWVCRWYCYLCIVSLVEE
ncbi:MAG TPA: hypothetical protein VK589_08650 [Chryseolinea sp.]|nr:hypothetical protein [Chryseolinea sp.]